MHGLRRQGVDPVTARHWDVRCTVLGRPPTANAHRRLHPYARSKVDQEWRSTFLLLARAAKVPALQRARIVALPLHADRRSPQDVAGCAPAVKAAVDGLVDADVLPNDNPAHLLAITFLPPDVCGEDGLSLRIVEVS